LDEVLSTPLRKKTFVTKHICEMLPLETKQSGGKLLPHSDLRGRLFLEEASRSKQARQQKRDLGLGTCNVRSLYRAGSLKVAVFGKWNVGVWTGWS
jgi:hypothetical protein